MQYKRYELTALKGLLREKKVTYKEIANVIRKTERVFSNKINGYCGFDAFEVDEIAEYLGINPTDIVKYFFITQNPA